jgi:hypothetical protein
MDHVITVAAVEGGWNVSSSLFDNEMLFLNGGRAENAARELASRAEWRGLSTEVRYYLRDGTLLASRREGPAADLH